jgi:signal transduction histidine kinase
MGPDVIASILVLIGAGFMVFSIRLGRGLQRVVPNELKKRWQILILLKLFFLAGYLLFVSILFSSYNLPLELVTGIIFLGGAFFVFIVINLSKDTIRNIKEEKKEISEINSALELKVMEQTAELSNKNEQLMKYNASLEKTQQELKDAYNELKSAQSQMLQKEKMASIGQLAAGVAHEINNPMGFISSNVNSMGRYTKKLTEFINVQDEAIASAELPELSKELNEKRKKLKLDFILEDIDQLIEESLDGADRVKKIVQNLKSFSRVDEAEHQSVDINDCIESTLNIVWNELKYKATMTKDYGELPMTNCYPQQLNQVFMNLLVNAVQAIEKEGEITIRTWNGDGHVNISISDTGEGIPKDKMDRIFEPFYTTKPVGKGTGLGLSITYDIIKNHNGTLSVNSETGKGTTFNIKIPVIGNDNHA